MTAGTVADVGACVYSFWCWLQGGWNFELRLLFFFDAARFRLNCLKATNLVAIRAFVSLLCFIIVTFEHGLFCSWSVFSILLISMNEGVSENVCHQESSGRKNDIL